MADHDIPAVANFVLQRTGVEQIYWVAHSQGCAISFAGFLNSPSIAKRIAGFAALAPVTWLSHQTSPLMKMMVKLHLDVPLSALPTMKFVPSGAWLSRTLGVLCKAAPSLCDNVAGGLFGKTGPPNIAANKVQVYFGHFPDGTSTKNIVHWIKNARSGNYADRNGAVFDVARLQVPTVIYYGQEDMLGDPEDVKKLASTVKNLKALKQTGFSHMDFTWSPKAATQVYGPVVSWFNNGVAP
jgi:lysosomal acid lipase/cholesteryl ester hydrolase